MRFKGGYQLTPWLKISNNFEFSHNKYYNPITYSEGSGVVWRNISGRGTPRHRHCSTLMVVTMTYSAVLPIGDLLLWTRSGITTKNSNLKNTTTFNAKFLGDRLRVNGDFYYQQKTQEKTKNRCVRHMRGRPMRMAKVRSNISRVLTPTWRRQLIIRTI